MPLQSGVQLGPYQILSLLGAGGMGEVYQARDTRLDRPVAIKVLAPHLIHSTDVKDRFEREARTVASLSHPHICVLHDIGHHEDVDYLVMEYLEGETLLQRLTRGPLAIEEVLRYGIQIADALDKAHRQGITHRDLKPGNIMLTSSGAKLLDFGLAKLKGPEAGLGGLSMLPTQQASLTAEGTILGTFQYMAPEQLEGREADPRADIFAFGAVLYEMATGQKAFQGNSPASLIASIMSSNPPPVSNLQPMSPPALEHVIRTCLAKKADDRWQTAHDLMVQLRWISEAGSQAGIPVPVVTRRKSRERMLAAATVLSILVAFISIFVAVRSGGFLGKEADVSPLRFSLQLPGTRFGGVGAFMPELAVSPDGRKIAFTAVDKSRQRFLWVRSLSSFSAQRLEGTESARVPFWSPDSEHIGFFAQGKLKKIPFSGGSPQVLCDAQGPYGGTWGRDGVIVFATTRTGALQRVPDAGGVPVPVWKDSKTGQYQTWPQFLPHSNSLIYLSRRRGSEGIYLGSLASDEKKRLHENVLRARFAPPNYLLLVHGGMLLAQQFDIDTGQLQGEARSLSESVNFIDWGATAFSVSDNGVLAYRGDEGSLRKLIWYDREGKQTPINVENGEYAQVALSPDERRASVHRNDRNNADIWALDFSTGIFSRLTVDPGADTGHTWSSDGRKIVFTSARGGKKRLFIKDLVSGKEEALLDDEVLGVEDWTDDGKLIVFRTTQGVFRIASDKPERPEPLTGNPLNLDQVQVSPDGRWVAYNSDESGNLEVYVASFPTFSQKRQVSNNGGVQPLWRGDAKELFYLTREGKVMAVSIRAGSELEATPPQVLFATQLEPSWQLSEYAVTRDGQRFLFIEPAAQEITDSFNVIINWNAILSP